MHENYINNNKIKENKYKILRMSLILGSDDNREETINNFEESAREIDAMNDETYLNEIEGKFYDTLNLEEEEDKLAVLVDYIGGRVEQRISLLSDFANITGYDLSNLPPIKYYDKLDDYKERLKYIREYLNNTKEINKLTEEIDESEKKLKEAYESKKTSEEYNTRNEEIVLSKFKNAIKPIESLKDTDAENVDTKLNNIIMAVDESKKSLDIFTKSYTTLRGSGISFEEEAEYKSYVDNAKEIFYSNKEQEYLLKIYQLLFVKEQEYSKILAKRENINSILAERIELRQELEIEESDILNSLYDLLDKQFNDIEQQQNNIESIEYLTRLIENKKEQRNNLELENQKVEILSLLREFCIIDTYAGLEDEVQNSVTEEKVTEPIIETTNKPEEIASYIEPSKEEEIIPVVPFTPNNEKLKNKDEEPQKDNQVISVENATNIDLDLIQSKASKVMKRVGEMLGIKTEETKIISVINEVELQETKEQIKEEIKEETTTEPTIPNNPLPIENPLFGNTSNQLFEENNNPLFENVENPLFGGNIEINEPSVDPEDDNNFWFSSDMPDALNDLPDLEVSSDNFFGTSDMPELNFPDLKLDFGTSNTEDK